MEFKDYYRILGVAEDANNKGIKTAYRKLARKYHPDVSEHPDAEEKFKEAGEAYEVLKDPEKRTEYDALRQYGSQGQNFTPPPGGSVAFFDFCKFAVSNRRNYPVWARA
jgi:curved DNA-binding protein